MSPRKSPSKILIIFIGFILIGIGYGLSRLPNGKSVSPFPDELYLESQSSLNGKIDFKGRVRSELGRGQGLSSIQFSVLETASGAPLELVVLIPDRFDPGRLVPGQLYHIVARSDRGNMLVEGLEKF